MESKLCNTCNKMKPLNAFGINRKKGGNNFHAGMIPRHKGDCKDCLAEKARQWRKARPGYKGSGLTSKYPVTERLLLSAIRNRIMDAKYRNKRNPERSFDINADYMYELYIQQNRKCTLTGVALSLDKKTPLTLSIDKIIPENGYVQGNVQWVCWAANRAKGDMSLQNFISMCRSVLRTCNDYPEKEYASSEVEAHNPQKQGDDIV